MDGHKTCCRKASSNAQNRLDDFPCIPVATNFKEYCNIVNVILVGTRSDIAKESV
jgi:hypothetical protein